MRSVSPDLGNALRESRGSRDTTARKKEFLRTTSIEVIHLVVNVDDFRVI